MGSRLNNNIIKIVIQSLIRNIQRNILCRAKLEKNVGNNNQLLTAAIIAYYNINRK